MSSSMRTALPSPSSSSSPPMKATANSSNNNMRQQREMKKMPTTSMQDTVRPWTWPAKEAYWHSAVAGPGAVDLASTELRFNNKCCSSFAHLILVILSPSPPPPATSGQQCSISAKEDHGACALSPWLQAFPLTIEQSPLAFLHPHPTIVAPPPRK